MLTVFYIYVLLYGHGETVQAARTEDISEECQIIYFEDGSSLTVTSDTKTMTITGTHVKSSSRISYATVGYHMTLEPTNGYVEGKEYREITLLDKSEIITDEVTTSYVLDRQSIVDGAYALFRAKYPSYDSDEAWMKFVEEISVNGGIEFYLHNIFAVIERSGGSGSTVLATSKSYNNLGSEVGVSPRIPGILNAVEELYGSDWSEGTKRKLKEYYDIHLKLCVRPCMTNLVLAAEDGEILLTIAEDIPVYMNADVCFRIPDNVKERVTVGEEEYRLTQASIRKSFVRYASAGSPVQIYSLSDSKGLKVRLDAGLIEFKQLEEDTSTVYLICEKVKEDEENDKKEEITESGEIYKIRYTEPQNELAIQAWEEENPYFDVEDEAGGIPVNEKLILEGELWRYLLEAEFSVKNGEITFYVPVRRTYRLIWTEIVDETEEGTVYDTFEEEQKVEVYVPIVRKYSYAEIHMLECYGLSEVTVRNGALPDGEIKCRTGEGMLAGVVLPEVSYRHYEGQEAHIQYPSEAETGIELPTLILRGEGEMPAIPEEDFAALAEEQVSEIRVRSDAFCFDGTNYLTDEWRKFVEGTEIIPERAFGKLGKDDIAVSVTSDAVLIPSKVQNDRYESRGEAEYTQIAGYPAGSGKACRFEIDGINGVYVYTPVYCDAIWRADNKKYTQLVTPKAGAVQLVLDSEGITSEIWLGISNTGYHSARKGYGQRDYARTLGTPGLSYIARTAEGILRNEVRFPFDVFRDTGVLYVSADDTYIPAGEWTAIGRETVRFYLPEWVTEGVYTVECRSVACSCLNDTAAGEKDANRNPKNYIAADNITVQVSGRICGFCLYDIADYPVWEEVFRDGVTGNIKNIYENRRAGTFLENFDCEALYRYYSGMSDSYGRRRAGGQQYTLPVIAGDHPINAKAAVKAGYTVRFCVTTIGERMGRKDSYVNIIPRFFHVDENGENRGEVDLYYTRRFSDGKKYLVKIGDNEEVKDGKKQSAGSVWLGIPQIELAETEKVWGEDVEDKTALMYSYSLLRGHQIFRTVKNFEYRDRIAEHAQYPAIYNKGIAPEQLVALEQGNYFEYSLPYDVMAVEKDFPVREYAALYGVDFTEDFWKKDGFLIVSFDITAVVQENAYLSYTNEENSETGYCNMWELEAMQKEKRDKNGISFRFYPGDVMVVPVLDSIRNDYRFGGIY